ncbi:MAG: ice-binding family protein [Anaerolineae bacterium]
MLGTAQSFAVLAGSTATNTGPTTISGDLGVSPGSAVIGFPPGIVSGGTIYAGDAVAAQAQSDLTTAYNDLAGQTCDTNLTGQDLGGLTLTPGVYCFDTSAQLTGALVLDAEGDPAAVFVFQIASTLTTASGSSVSMINSGDACNVYWQVGSSATLGTNTAFVGSILALTSITLNTGAQLDGRALARNGAVTMDTNDISNICWSAPSPTPTSTPSATPTNTSAATPTNTPSATPTNTSAATPTTDGTTAAPTGVPTALPTALPTNDAAEEPTEAPTLQSSPTLTLVPVAVGLPAAGSAPSPKGKRQSPPGLLAVR